MANASAARRSGALRWALRGLLLVLAALAVVALIRALRGLDLPAIGAAFGRLRWWEIAILLGVLVLRHLFAALPLTIYIPGVSLWRATINDLTAMTTAAFAPAPGDIVVRIAIFTSWGIPAPTAIAGAALNALSMFVVRFGVPLIGFVLVAVSGSALGVRLVDILSLLLSAALVVTMVLVASAEKTAERIGEWAARVVRRIRAGVESENWGRGFSAFQQAVAGNLGRRMPRALLAVTGMICCELALLFLALRFVGLSPSDATALEIAAAFFFAYPLTMFPVQGAGVVDVAILLGLFGTSSTAAVETATAGLLVWRAFTIAGAYLLGLVAVAVWRGGLRRRPPR